MGPTQRNGKKNDVQKKSGNGVNGKVPLQEGPMKAKLTPQKKLNVQLLEAVEKDNLEKVKDALAKGADADAMDNEKFTVLKRASLRGNTEMAKLLLDWGADVNLNPEDGFSPLTWAILCRHTETAKLLRARGASIDTKDAKSMLGIVSDNTEIREFLNELIAEIKKPCDDPPKTDSMITVFIFENPPPMES